MNTIDSPVFGKKKLCSVYFFCLFILIFCSVMSLKQATEHRRVESVLEGGFDWILKLIIQTKVCTFSANTPSDTFRWHLKTVNLFHFSINKLKPIWITHLWAHARRSSAEVVVLLSCNSERSDKRRRTIKDRKCHTCLWKTKGGFTF